MAKQSTMRNPEVDGWFKTKKHPHLDAMQEVRRITLATDSRITESIKWSTPTFAHKGNIFSFNPAKNFVSLLFHTGAVIPGKQSGAGGGRRHRPGHAFCGSGRRQGPVKGAHFRAPGVVQMEGRVARTERRGQPYE